MVVLHGPCAVLKLKGRHISSLSCVFGMGFNIVLNLYDFMLAMQTLVINYCHCCLPSNCYLHCYLY